MRIDAARAFLVEDPRTAAGSRAGAEVDRDVDFTAEPAVQRVGDDALRELRFVDELAPQRAGADGAPRAVRRSSSGSSAANASGPCHARWMRVSVANLSVIVSRCGPASGMAGYVGRVGRVETGKLPK